MSKTMNIDEFTEFADHVLDKEIPQVLLRELNLGVCVFPEAKEEQGYYIMGEYVVNEMGKHIALYFGSFQAILDGESLTTWKEEIRDTIKHELQHHIEALAGEETLAKFEEEEGFDE
ncbi:metallopeptidase family protein [Natranaerobius thermophilus]|uniref:Metallopeptidase family protein n=1 Tax=Natranaerobius thermophilus (strain ATCC BAA-1301 / DSM 18059 / JW/NM-WN-LF) TaxID=457570 RepID=B2A7H9_NATTJ|nr:metallopeptidase family protein [Natranaerobius thermophilus]ACB85688.1 conserved hypothetical protein [Natranaerobius thermophilus JW/NM-WN-LF]